MVAVYDQRRKLVLDALEEIPGIECPPVEGAFYVFPKFTQTKKSSDELTAALIDEALIVTTPGSAFGPAGEGHVRFSIAERTSDLEKMVERLARVGAEAVEIMREAPAPRTTALLLVVITLVGGLLRVWALGAKSLWLDEAFSIWLARQPLGELWSWLVRIDQHPPLYYTLLQLWLRLGDDAGTVRLLSALCSTATIPVLFAIGRRLGGPALGLTAALILALAPFHVRFAQEARMYALLTLNAGLALLMLVYLLTDPARLQPALGSQLLAWLRRRGAPAGGGAARRRHRSRLGGLHGLHGGHLAHAQHGGLFPGGCQRGGRRADRGAAVAGGGH